MYERFVELLQKHGVTAYKVSKATGISNGSLSDWKSGRSTPKYESLSKIADFFGVSVDYLLGKEEKEKAPSISEEEVKVALFGGEGEVTPEMWDDVRAYVESVKMKYGKK